MSIDSIDDVVDEPFTIFQKLFSQNSSVARAAQKTIDEMYGTKRFLPVIVPSVRSDGIDIHGKLSKGSNWTYLGSVPHDYLGLEILGTM